MSLSKSSRSSSTESRPSSSTPSAGLKAASPDGSESSERLSVRVGTVTMPPSSASNSGGGGAAISRDTELLGRKKDGVVAVDVAAASASLLDEVEAIAECESECEDRAEVRRGESNRSIKGKGDLVLMLDVNSLSL